MDRLDWFRAIICRPAKCCLPKTDPFRRLQGEEDLHFTQKHWGSCAALFCEFFLAPLFQHNAKCVWIWIWTGGLSVMGNGHLISGLWFIYHESIMREGMSVTDDNQCWRYIVDGYVGGILYYTIWLR